MSRLIHPVEAGQRHAGEARDCTVRALANASGMPYIEARAVLAKHGRRSRCGANMRQYHPAYLECGFRLAGIFGTTSRARIMGRWLSEPQQAGTTLASILPRLRHGRFIVLITGHALAVVDGKTIDQGPNMAGARVFAVYKRPL